jgi:hypothetical protein
MNSVRLVSANGGGLEVLAREPGVRSWDACWVSDGRSVVFGDGTRPGLYQVDVTTRTVVPLKGGEELIYPKCGPHGAILASRKTPDETGRERPSTFMLFRPERGTWEDFGPERLGFPNWTRDGRLLCGLSLPSADRIECYSFESGRWQTVAETGDLPLFNWTGFPWIGLDIDDNPLVVVDRSTRELFAIDWEAP